MSSSDVGKENRIIGNTSLTSVPGNNHYGPARRNDGDGGGGNHGWGNVLWFCFVLVIIAIVSLSDSDYFNDQKAGQPDRHRNGPSQHRNREPTQTAHDGSGRSFGDATAVVDKSYIQRPVQSVLDGLR